MGKIRPNPRKLMEQAIEVMRASVGEPRAEGEAGLLVGAVLWKPDGTVDTACRGELRYGDHAEYTLLDKKNYDQRLDGAVLFTTLEPCASGSRSHPKRSCAERIVAARIREVWVGVADPDPTVDGKGIKYMQDCGVNVQMFDRDLQETIHLENKQWMTQALERAAEAKEAKKRKAVLPSNLEKPFATAAINDFSNEALEEYRRTAKIEDQVDSSAFNRRLASKGSSSTRMSDSFPQGSGSFSSERSRERSFRRPAYWPLSIIPTGRKNLAISTGLWF
jgi:ATP-dependent DNA helicase RecG